MIFREQTVTDMTWLLDSLVFQNHKIYKIRPKFLPIMHFLQESYEFVKK